MALQKALDLADALGDERMAQIRSDRHRPKRDGPMRVAAGPGAGEFSVFHLARSDEDGRRDRSAETACRSPR